MQDISVHSTRKSPSTPSGTKSSHEPPADETSQVEPAPSRMWMFSHWLYTVFLQRRLHVPGDSCRYIWQKTSDVDRRFVIYRAAYAFCHLLNLLISLFHVSNNCPPSEEAVSHWLCFGSLMGVTHSWPFYLTRWGIMLNFSQSVIAFVIVFSAYRRQKRDLDNPYASSREHSLLTLTGLSWILHSFALILSILIDVNYWVLIVGRFGHGLGLFLGLTEHCLNFILLAIDHAVVAFPVLFIHGVAIVIFAILYTLVNFVYYVSGGRDFTNRHNYLYDFLNWDHPGDCILMVVMLSCFAFVLLLILLLIDYFKFKCRPLLLTETVSGERLQEHGTKSNKQ